MSGDPVWKRVLQESNAIGWIAFILVVIGIGVGTVYFGAGNPPNATLGLNHTTK